MMRNSVGESIRASAILVDVAVLLKASHSERSLKGAKDGMQFGPVGKQR
jgi:hypothetical protein